MSVVGDDVGTGESRKGSICSSSFNTPSGMAPVGSSKATARHPDSRHPDARRAPCGVRCSRAIVDNVYFVIGTTVLTIYALIGDDFKLMLTDKPADSWFDVATTVCIVVFSVEVVLSCVGKDDYWLSFFFWLDALSTITLVMDLSSVNETILTLGSGGNSDEVEQFRSGRSARLGARAGRVVRVIRLVRILKLYKAVHEAKTRANAVPPLPPEEDDWERNDDDRELASASVGLEESRVGKKLSELTTRRVIILVLTMLIVLPFLRTESAKEAPSSALYGADDVWEAYAEWRDDTTVDTGQWRYENALLKYIYYHNWFDSESHYYSHVFWVGMASRHYENLVAQADYVQLRESSVDYWEHKAATQDNLLPLGTIPAEVQASLPQPWDPECSDASKDMYLFGISLLNRTIDDAIRYAVPCPGHLRFSELRSYTPQLMTRSESEQWHFVFYFDARPFTRSEARFGVIITTFICVVLVVASIFFSRDANKLVLNPLEKMVQRVMAIRADPLVAMKMADEEFKAEEKQKDRAASRPKPRFFERLQDCWRDNAREPMETVVLEKTIIKLGSLLALGFGEAGANIIGQNMASSDSAGVNAMIHGFKVDCIVGKARIRNFSTATEVLQGKVMTFVNQIAEIVHGVVDEFHGAANKNNGDTFLLIWRLPQERELLSKMADMSVFAFAKIYAAIHCSSVLATYRRHPGLQQRLGSGCRVTLSFGLHAGWAIEGAVGSEFKIDASYLSPNVNIASNVEAATTTYAVPLIISETVIDLMSYPCSKHARIVDRVVIKGSKTPLRIYSLDLDCNNLAVEPPRPEPATWNSRQRFRVRQQLEAEKMRKLDPAVQMIDFFDFSEEIRIMRQKYTLEFLQVFQMGYENYYQGEWDVACCMLTRTRTMLPGGQEDGPSLALLRFMESHAFTAPYRWDGVRELICTSAAD